MQPGREGACNQSSHKYLALQLKINGNSLNGWLKISFDTATEKIVLNQAAICTESGKTIKAGF